MKADVKLEKMHDSLMKMDVKLEEMHCNMQSSRGSNNDDERTDVSKDATKSAEGKGSD
jgi:hypothetical protein